ncbi:MAG: ABC transporter permease [Acidobacteriaceae bacterium]
MWNDLKFALRQLRKSPGFTLAAVLTLAIGIGANTAVFSLVHAILLRQLPFNEPARVATLKDYGNLCSVGICSFFASPNDPAGSFHAGENTIHSFSHVAEYSRQSANFSGSGISAQRLAVTEVSSHFMDVLGVNPLLGRNFQDGEDIPGHDAEMLISYHLWQTAFGGSPAVIGRSIHLNGHLFTVIGVAPQGMSFPEESELWTPTLFDSHLSLRDEGAFMTPTIARLRDGVTMRQGQAELDTLYAARNKQQGAEGRPVLVSIASALTKQIRPALLMLSGAVLLVLLIACANVAGMMLARATDRRAELTIRAALGASRGWLMRQQFVESLALALCGGVAGVVCALGLVRLIYLMRPAALAGFPQPSIELPVLLYTLAVSVATGLLFGIAPAWFAGKQEPGGVLKSGQWRSSRGGSRLHRVLVCSEIALAIVLLTGAGLLIRTMRNLSATPLGFEADHLLTFSITVHGGPYEADGHWTEAVHSFQSRVLEGLRGLPGDMSAAGVNKVPMGKGMGMLLPLKSTNGTTIATLFRTSTPGYFRTMGIPLLQGRDFAESDGAHAPKVAIISRDLAQKLWPGQSPIGRQLTCPWTCGKSGATVIGVAAPVRNFGARGKFYPAYYLPYNQYDLPNMTFVLLTKQDPRDLIPAVRDVVARVDPSQPIFHLETMRELSTDTESLARMEWFVLSIFGFLALLLAATGIYAMISYTVARRTHEIGLRMALGAERVDIARAVFMDTIRMNLIGAAVGLLGAVWMGRVLQSALYGVSASDPATMVAAVALFLAVSLLAAFVPARRAASIDPMVALRNE